MASENFDKIYYSVYRSGMYIIIDKIGVKRDPESQRNTETLISKYLYPQNASYAQSINNEVEEGNYEFGLLLINSMSRGTFVFSANGIKNAEYYNRANLMPFTYDELLAFLTNAK